MSHNVSRDMLDFWSMNCNFVQAFKRSNADSEAYLVLCSDDASVTRLWCINGSRHTWIVIVRIRFRNRTNFVGATVRTKRYESEGFV